ncbi:hypothetical protein GQ54DRAFT_319142 [Martensiomyces pterosporus]|nr:hypothetical protein GQ54DRAFT_319142 [Martensiomyces pterosporus]
MRTSPTILLAVASTIRSALVVNAAPAPVQPNLIVFGDSLSDNGNTAALTHNSTGYWQGHASNSYVWNEYVAKLLDLKLENHAYGGATSNNVLSPVEIGNITIPSFHDQVDAWLQQNQSPSPFNLNNDIIQVEIGSNDVFRHLAGLLNGTTTVLSLAAQLSSNIGDDVQRLADAGYKNINVWNLPTLDRTPAVLSLGAAALVKPLIAFINGAISIAINSVIARSSSRTQGIHLLDLNHLMGVAFDPQVLAALGVVDSTDACYVKSASGQVTVCSNPDQHVFYDNVHPGSRVHYLWGVFASVLTRNPDAIVDVPAALALIKTFDIQDSNHDNNIIVGGITSPESSAIPPDSTTAPTSTTPVVVPTAS